MIGQSVSRKSIILGLFAIATTGMIVLTATLTRDRIAEEKANALIRSLLEVMPADRLDNKLVEDQIQLESDALLGTNKALPAYIARKNGEPTGVILQVSAPEGYGGTINLLVGVSSTGEITGVRVIPPHFETPGLGDAIELQKSKWILSFNGKSLQNTAEKNWHVKKDGGEFDAFTGATITPRAVVDAVHKALLYVSQHKDTLLIAPVEGFSPVVETSPVEETSHGS